MGGSFKLDNLPYQMVNHEWNIDSPWHNVVGQLLKLQLLLVLYWGGIRKDGKAGAAYVLLKKHREKHNSKNSATECLLLNLIILNKKIYS